MLENSVAVRHGSADDVADVVCSVLRDVGHRVLPMTGAAARHVAADDVVVGPETAGWVVVSPHYVVPSGLLAMELSRRLGAVASAVGVYEDVLWSHQLVDRGTVLDRYVNLPGYFGPGEYGPEHDGNPGLVAATLGVDAAQIEPYFRQLSVRRARSRLLPPPKAHPSDTYHLLDGWVVTELWARMGISWLEPGRLHARVPLASEMTMDLYWWLHERHVPPREG